MARTEKTRRGKAPAQSNPVDTEGVTRAVFALATAATLGVTALVTTKIPVPGAVPIV